MGPFRKVTIVGSGIMGSSIGLLCAISGLEVVLVDLEKSILERSLDLIKEGLQVLISFSLCKKGESEIIQKLSFQTDLKEGVKGADFVIEAVPEKIDIKRDIFKEIEKACDDKAIIASNTSGINVFEIAGLKRPERLIITHFFNPAHIIPLVEIVLGPETSERTLSLTEAFIKGLGKRPIVLKKFCPGFIVNRIQRAIGETVLEMIEEGIIEPKEIDLAVKLTLGVRLPILGVLQTFDFQGLDMLYDAMRFYGRVFPFIEEKVKRGELGVKTSKGIYDYKGKGEREILKKRDELFLEVLRFFEKIKAFEQFEGG